MYLPRILKLKDLISAKSCFLFGPRGTGKSKLIQHELGESACVINLLKTQFQLQLTAEPYRLESIIKAEQTGPRQLIVIDEIQKVPILLDEVHRLIEEQNRRFLLTGSSARRLKQKSVNLLGGRARRAELFPLTSHEIPDFDLERYLRYGGVPGIWLSSQPDEDLDAYLSNYISEEIKAEGAVRKIAPFIEFLRFAALTNGKELNYSNLANDAGVSAPTIASYYEILQDTLLGTRIEPWKKSTFRKSVSSAKFYLFDTGVTNAIAGTQSVDRNSDLFGQLFEQFIFMELRAFLSYRRSRAALNFWRTEDQCEVDFVIGGEVGIEVKSSRKTSFRDCRHLHELGREKTIKRLLLVSNNPVNRIEKRIEHLHWETFLDRLWSGKVW